MDWITYVRTEELTFFFKGVTYLGSEYIPLFLIPTLYWGVDKKAGIKLFIITIASFYIGYLLKNAFALERPPIALRLVEAGGFGFPSGHAMTATVVWGFLLLYIRRIYVSISSIAIILLVASSRLYLGVHYPIDVLGGIACGAIILVLGEIASGYIEKYKAFTPYLGIATVGLAILASFLHKELDVCWGMGLISGAIIGSLIEPFLANMKRGDSFRARFLRCVIGWVTLASVWWIFDRLTPPADYGMLYLKMFAIGIYITAGAPFLFVRTKWTK
jgi:hypothetical protein